MRYETILPGLYRFEDECNVYLIADGDAAIAIDFGSGGWVEELPGLGISKLEGVYLTHHHADQCRGLASGGSGEPAQAAVVHAPVGEEAFLEPSRAQELSAPDARVGKGCPPSYSVLPEGIEGVQYDMRPDADLYWRGRRLRFVSTPGHSPNALSIVLDHDGQQLVFCGDAAHAGAVVWEPYHLEWDHWTATGALSAWHGVKRLEWSYADLLLPSHGQVVREDIRGLLDRLAGKLLRLVVVKGGTAPWEPDRYLSLTPTESGARRISPHLYHYGANGYLLISDSGRGFVVDPTKGDRTALHGLLSELPELTITAATATHYHLDHCDDLPYLRDQFGTRVLLHPLVAEPLRNPANVDAPWLPAFPVQPDEDLPERGAYRWEEYEFSVYPAPGQTRWHAMFAVTVDAVTVLFAGDSFQPSSRWHGTGGFCAYNRSRFSEGFVPTCRTITDLAPDVIAAGHGTIFHYSPSRFEKTAAWAEEAEAAVRDLCPQGDIENQYFVFSLTT